MRWRPLGALVEVFMNSEEEDPKEHTSGPYRVRPLLKKRKLNIRTFPLNREEDDGRNPSRESDKEEPKHQ